MLTKKGKQRTGYMSGAAGAGAGSGKGNSGPGKRGAQYQPRPSAVDERAAPFGGGRGGKMSSGGHKRNTRGGSVPRARKNDGMGY